MTTDQKSRKIAHYGWIPDLPDHRDFLVTEPSPDQVANLPHQFSLRSQEPEPCYYQGQLGSCTSNGGAFAIQFERAQQKLPPTRPSRLFIYYFERLIEGTIGSDSGASIRDCMKVLGKYGAPPESLWPYDISKFTQPPPQSAVDAGLKDLAVSYVRVPRSINAIKMAIFGKHPVVDGFTVYESFESPEVAKTGLMPMPQRGESVLGGHCTSKVGWDDTIKLPGGLVGAFEVRNSWGIGWGDQGHFWMPYGVVLNRGMSSDFWMIQSVEEGA